MPVTTRLCAKFLKGVEQEATKPISPDSAIPSSTTINNTIISSVNIPSHSHTPTTLDVVFTTTESDVHNHCSTRLLSLLLEVSHFETLKFQTVQTSKLQMVTTPSMVTLPNTLCHNL